MKMSEEKEHLLWHAEARGRWWLEERDDLVKIFVQVCNIRVLLNGGIQVLSSRDGIVDQSLTMD